MRNIKSERIRAGYKIEQVAEILHVHPNTIQRWEAGTAEPGGRHLVALGALFGCTPDYLLGCTEERNGKAVALV